MIPNWSKWFPWSSRNNFIPFRIFRGPLFHKPVTGQELFFAVSYSKPALCKIFMTVILSWLELFRTFTTNFLYVLYMPRFFFTQFCCLAHMQQAEIISSLINYVRLLEFRTGLLCIHGSIWMILKQQQKNQFRILWWIFCKIWHGFQ